MGGLYVTDKYACGQDIDYSSLWSCTGPLFLSVDSPDEYLLLYLK